MKIISHLTLFLLLISLGACSLNNSTDAKLKVAFGAQIDMTQYPGGVVMWGKRIDGTDAFAEVIPAGNNGEITASLPNGVWDFYVVGWQAGKNLGTWDATTSFTYPSAEVGDYMIVDVSGSQTTDGSSGPWSVGDYVYKASDSKWYQSTVLSSDPMQGRVSCASSMGQELGGGEVDINLTLSNANCDSNIFSPSRRAISNGVAFPKIWDLHTCRDIADITGNGSSCGGKKGLAHSFKIKIPSFRHGDAGRNFPMIGGELSTGCIVIPSATDYATVGTNFALNIPLGNESAPFTTKIESYWSEDCSGTPMSKILPTGIYKADSNAASGLKTYVSGDFTYLFHSVDERLACGVLGENGFAYGDGTENRPYGICSGEDLNKMSQMVTADTMNAANNVSGSGASYMLLRDIDMNPLTKVVGDYPALPYFDCQGEGSNYMPAGAQFSAAPTCTYSLVKNYNGTLDGRNHNIDNLRFEAHNTASSVGLFAELSSIASVKNVFLRQPSFQGTSEVGTIAGTSSCSACSIDNIYISDIEVRGRENSSISNVGGILGYAQGVNMSNIHVFHGNVTAEGNYVGGIIGAVSGSNTYSQLSYQGGIFADEYNGVTSDYVGGLFGDHGTATASESFFEGVVSSKDSTSVGFISGADNTNTNSSIMYDNTNASKNHASGARAYKPASSTEVTYAPELDMTKSFAWETALNLKDPLFHNCIVAQNRATVASQIASGRGVDTNPITLCSVTQFNDIATYPSKSYRVEANIQLGEWYTKRIPSFSGKIFGNRFMLYNLSLLRNTTDTGNYLSLFQNFSGELYNLHFFGVSAAAGGSDGGAVAPIIGVNNGTITKVSADFVIVSSDRDNGTIAGFVAENNGNINMLQVSGVVDSTFNTSSQLIGGVIGTNNGNVFRISSDMNVSSGSYTDGDNFSDTVGGVVAVNGSNGSLSQAIFDGAMAVGKSTQIGDAVDVTFSGKVGGVAGINSGAISDSITSKYVHFQINSTASAQVAPIVANSSGTINRVFYGGMFDILNITPSTAGPLVGTGSYTGKYLNDVYKYLTSQSLNGLSAGPVCVDKTSVTLQFSSSLGGSVNTGDVAVIDYDGLREPLPVQATPSTDVPVLHDFLCSDISPSVGSSVNFYSPLGLTDANKLNLISVGQITNYSGWNIAEDFEGQPISNSVLQAHLQNNVDLGPTWIISDHDDGAAMPQLFWSEFIH